MALVALAVPGVAQETGRDTLRVSVTGVTVYDDNIYFEREDRQGAVMTRLRPAITGTHRLSRAFSLDGSYSFDADYSPSQPDVNKLFASQAAALGGQYQAGPRTSVRVGLQYSTSATASDLIGGSGLELGRLRGRAWGVQAGASRRITKGGALGLDYSYQAVSFGDASGLPAQSLSVNWTHQLTSRTGLSMGAGPRFVDGATSAEAMASIAHRLEHGSFSLSYGRSRYPAPGRAVDAESVSGAAELILSPTLTISASPGLFRQLAAEGDADRSRSLRMLVSAAWQVRRGVGVGAMYQHVRQDGRLGQAPAILPGPWLSRNLFAVSFSVGMKRPRDTRANPGIGPTTPGSTR
jgi:hypothetical protein